MRVIANILAHILSLVFYPLFVPTYGIALFCYAFQCPMVWSAVAIIGTVLLTCVLPMTAIGIMIHKGKVKDIQISNAAERTLPYLYSTIGFMFWSYLIGGVLEAPLFLTLVAVGATVALGIVTIINRYWKISARLTGIGGLIGGWMSSPAPQRPHEYTSGSRVAIGHRLYLSPLLYHRVCGIRFK